MLASATAAAFAATTASAQAIEPILQGFNSPVGIHALGDADLLVSNWGGGTVERVGANRARTVFLDGISSPAGIAVDATGAVFVSSYSSGNIVRIAPDGSRKTIAEGLATPTGIAFARDGRLLIANRSSGEIVTLNTATGSRSVVARGLSLPVGVAEMPDGSIVSSQYGGRLTRILPGGKVHELGQSFNRPGVGILADGDNAVLVIDNGASVVRRVSFDGQSSVVVDGLSGSAVALGRAANGDLLIGTWGGGNIYRVAWPKS
ncbi:serine/threonine protein kinase [Roseomonas mucosa]|uniref:Serine/threonine protein kinase n=2 Tax=Roseomonas mucosa TaxID=207340 RepID=A0A1S8D9N5_9PROT|nr:serine/threonine protein kinase [Roseomonas mucosa]